MADVANLRTCRYFPFFLDLNRCNLFVRLPLSNMAMACERYGISDRAAAAVASAVVNDFDNIHDADISKVVDRNNVRRERETLWQDMLSSQKNFRLNALVSDCRKDNTLVQEKVENKKYPKKRRTCITVARARFNLYWTCYAC